MQYTETVQRLVPITREESVNVPEGLIKLVKGNDKKWGKNGYAFMGYDRDRQGGNVIDRLREYISHHNTYHVIHSHPCDCPVKL